MDTSTPFKWRHFEAEIILLCMHYTFGIRFLQHNPRDLVLSSDASNRGTVELQEVA